MQIKRAKNGSTIHRDLEEEEEEVTAKEDKMMIEEFKERLFFNIGMVSFSCFCFAPVPS